MRIIQALLACGITIALCDTVLAQSGDGEDFHIEVTAALCRLNTTGQVQSGSVPVDLELDLGVANGRNTFRGKVAAKPARKHRLIFEAVPYRLRGNNILNRHFQFQGRTYHIEDRLESEADLTYLYGGYQYDFVSTKRGHAGIQGGAAYVNARASLRSQGTGLSATASQKLALPLAGGEFRAFLIPNRDLLNVNGEVKGMSFGRFGRFFEAGAHVGIGFRYVTFQAGYIYTDIDLKDDDLQDLIRFKPRFSGPIFSIQFRDR